MREDEVYIEQMLFEDAAKIKIDQQFKADLKKRLMEQGKVTSIAEVAKAKRNYKTKYVKIASGFIIFVFVGGAAIRFLGGSNPLQLANKGIRIKEQVKVAEVKSVHKGSSEGSIEQGIEKEEFASKDTKKDSVKITPSVLTTVKDEIQNIEKRGTSELQKKATDTSNASQQKSGSNIQPKPTPSEADRINDQLDTPGKNASSGAGDETPYPTEVPPMEEAQENVGGLPCYDSRYSPDGKEMIIATRDGIYAKELKNGTLKKLVAIDPQKYIVEKPNFMPSGDVIYFKAEKMDEGIIKEETGAIYRGTKDGQSNTKILSGKNPMVSKDGQKLAYEQGGNIYILDIATNSSTLIDQGGYPAWSENGKMISYVKQLKETQSYDHATEEKEVYLEKKYSTVWVYDIHTQNKYNLTSREFIIDNKNVEAWAEAVRRGKVTYNFNVHGKYTYFESIWSTNNKELYIIRRDNETEIYELIKYNLDM